MLVGALHDVPVVVIKPELIEVQFVVAAPGSIGYIVHVPLFLSAAGCWCALPLFVSAATHALDVTCPATPQRAVSV